MKKWMGVGCVLLAAGALAAAVPVASGNEMSAASTGVIRDFEAILRGPIFSIIGAFLVIGLIVSIMRSQYSAAGAFGAGILLLILTFLFTGSSAAAYYGPNGAVMATNETTSPFAYELQLYGDGQADMVNSEFSINNNIVKGYLISACVLVNRIFTWFFNSALISIFIIALVLYGLWGVVRSPSPWKVLSLYVVIFIFGFFLVFPFVRVHLGPANSITYSQLQGLYSQANRPDYAPASDTPRIPILPAVFLSFTNQVANGFGRAMRGESVPPYETLNRIASVARMNPGASTMYRQFSDNCFISVQNLNGMSSAYLIPQEVEVANELASRRDEWRDEYRLNQHALSRASDHLFMDVEYDGYIVNQHTDWNYEGYLGIEHTKDMMNRLSDSLIPSRIPEEYIDEHAALIPIQRWDRFPKMSGYDIFAVRAAADFRSTIGISSSTTAMTGKLSPENVLMGTLLNTPVYNDELIYLMTQTFKAMVDYALSFGSSRLSESTLYRGYCASHPEFSYDYAARTFLPVPMSNGQPQALAARNIKSGGFAVTAANYGDIVRLAIMEPYIGSSLSSVRDTCFAAAKIGRTSPDLWGCLVTGFYNAPMSASDTEKYQGFINIQKTFDDHLRSGLLGATARNGSVVGLGRSGPSGGYANGFNDLGMRLMPGAGGWPQLRTLTDIYMMAPGVGIQIGLHHQAKQAVVVEEAKMGLSRFNKAQLSEDGWSIFSFIGGTMAKVFSWFSIIMSDIALKMWPYAMGWAYTFLILSWIPYSIISLVPGRHGMFMEWFKAALWIAFWPVVMHMGFNELNSLAGTEMSGFYTNMGGDSMSQNIRRIWGASLVIGAPALSAMFIILGMGGLMAGMGSAVGSAFTLMRSMFILPIAALGGTIGAAAGGAAGGLLSRTFNAASNRLTGRDSPKGYGSDSPDRNPGSGPGPRPRLPNRPPSGGGNPGAGQRIDKD